MEALQNRREGFTLTELIVIICVLALLPGLLFSGLNGSREEADKAACINNLGKLQAALQSYSNDFDGWMLSSQSPYVRYNTGAPHPARPWFELLHPYGEHAFLDYGWAHAVGAWADLGGNIRCPAEEDTGVSYGLNYRGVGTSASNEPAPRDVHSTGPRRMQDVSEPANFIWAGDTNFTGYGHTLSSVTEERLRFRHNGAVNMLLLDGRVRTYDRAAMRGANTGRDHNWIVFALFRYDGDIE